MTLSWNDIADGVIARDRRMIAKALTLVESTRPEDRSAREDMLKVLLPHCVQSKRIGLTGSPGVGKSSLIESFGNAWIERGHRVAVLAVDPSSARTGGSILGDKVRMSTLSRHEAAFIRPSPSGITRGGLAPRTRESIIVCEAAGFDVVLVETVGVGQSEFHLSSVVDLFVLLLSPHAGDDVQAVKRGIMEMAHIYAVTKADTDTVAVHAALSALHGIKSLLRPVIKDWTPSVVATSATTRSGVDELLERCEEFFALCSDAIQRERMMQRGAWFDERVQEEIFSRFFYDEDLAARRVSIREQVLSGPLSVPDACRLLFNDK